MLTGSQNISQNNSYFAKYPRHHRSSDLCSPNDNTNISQFLTFTLNPFKPELTIVIFIHYKPQITVAILDL